MMHMMRFLPAAALAVALMTGSETWAEYTLIGSGTDSCGTWTADRSDTLRFYQNRQWILGFLSGVGFIGTEQGVNPLKGVDAKAVWAWMENYCQAHPLVSIATAGEAFIREHPH